MFGNQGNNTGGGGIFAQPNTNSQTSIFTSNNNQQATGTNTLFGGKLNLGQPTSNSSTPGIFDASNQGFGTGNLPNANQQSTISQTQPSTQNSNLAQNASQGIFNSNNSTNPLKIGRAHV